MITVCMILAIILAPVLGADQERGADWLQSHTINKLGSKSRVQQVRIALGPQRQTTQRLVERYMQAAAEQRPVQHIQTQLEASKRRMTTAKAHLMKEFNMDPSELEVLIKAAFPAPRRPAGSGKSEEKHNDYGNGCHSGMSARKCMLPTTARKCPTPTKNHEEKLNDDDSSSSEENMQGCMGSGFLQRLDRASRIRQLQLAKECGYVIGQERVETQRLMDIMMKLMASKKNTTHVRAELMASKKRMTAAKARLMQEFNMDASELEDLIKGQFPPRRRLANRRRLSMTECTECDGSGYTKEWTRFNFYINVDCKRCNGDGWYETNEIQEAMQRFYRDNGRKMQPFELAEECNISIRKATQYLLDFKPQHRRRLGTDFMTTIYNYMPCQRNTKRRKKHIRHHAMRLYGVVNCSC
jgi:uncharacterized membrane-anchored protein YhcB (DUF1043 family)